MSGAGQFVKFAFGDDGEVAAVKKVKARQAQNALGARSTYF